MDFLQFLTPLHDLTEIVIGGAMPHSHWWFHVVVHMSVVFVPLAFLTLFLAWIYHISQRLVPKSDIDTLSESPEQAPAFSAHFLRYYLRHSRRAQLFLTVMALGSLPIFYATLELPKTIINNAINGEGFPLEILGISIGKVEFLLLLCLLYLLAIAGNGLAKYCVNLWQGKLSERMTRRLRLTLFRNWRRGSFSRDPATIIPVLAQEVEPIGGFSGEAIVLPLQQGGTFLTILIFFFLQDPLLAAGALTLVPLQLYLIPKLQQRVNKLARKRVREIRHMSQKVAEEEEDNPMGTMRVLASIRRIQDIRFQLYRRKFLIKSLNNFLTGITPFFFYSIGGLLVIEERLSLGALVAAISAYKDFSSPLKEMLGYYQRYEDVRVRFDELRNSVNLTHTSQMIALKRKLVNQ